MLNYHSEALALLPLPDSDDWLSFHAGHVIWRWSGDNLLPLHISQCDVAGGGGSTLAIGSSDRFLSAAWGNCALLWDLEHLSPVGRVDHNPRNSHQVFGVFSTCEQGIIATQTEKKIRLWDATTLKRKKVLSLQSARQGCNQIMVAGPENLLIAATSSGIWTWDLDSWAENYRFRRVGGGCFCFALSTNRKYMLSHRSQAITTDLVLTSVETGEVLKVTGLQRDNVPISIEVDKTGQIFYVATREGQLLLVCQKTGDISLRYSSTYRSDFRDEDVWFSPCNVLRRPHTKAMITG
ncbi:hypothetical protein [Thalassobius sp. I31.1]|uniref:hypothetical protein n=1 Tax=Thalassobius sp. I31.1 TaxID=2109912 RepID=UPI000D1C0E48|nr:hypothetical protein [Thalassobius sp. I31.1]